MTGPGRQLNLFHHLPLTRIKTPRWGRHCATDQSELICVKVQSESSVMTQPRDKTCDKSLHEYDLRLGKVTEATAGL